MAIIGNIAATELRSLLESGGGGMAGLLLLDCRPFTDYNTGHIVGARNVSCPSIVRRRAGGMIPLLNVMGSAAERDAVIDGRYHTAVAYDQATAEMLVADSILYQSLKVLREATPLRHVHFLQGGYESFVAQFSHLCQMLQPMSTPYSPAIYLTPATGASPGNLFHQVNLNTTATSSGGFNVLTPSCGLQLSQEPMRAETPMMVQDTIRRYPDNDLGDPVMILPWLYLGNSYHASRHDRLQQLGVTALLNVAATTTDLESTSSSTSLTVMNMPVTDTSTAEISCWFPEAIEFIEKIRESGGKVLVHCQAGISRSATISIAYVMYHDGFTLDQAHDFVKAKRSVISPNMNFMRQLAEFEDQLAERRVRSTSRRKSPVVCLSTQAWSSRERSMSCFLQVPNTNRNLPGVLSGASPYYFNSTSDIERCPSVVGRIVLKHARKSCSDVVYPNSGSSCRTSLKLCNSSLEMSSEQVFQFPAVNLMMPSTTPSLQPLCSPLIATTS